MTLPKYARLTDVVPARHSAASVLPAAPTVRRPDTSPAGLAAVGVVGFVVLGALSSALGPALPTLQDRHDLSATAASLLLTAFFGGATTGVVVTGVLRRRMSTHALLAAGGGAVAIGCLALPLSGGVALTAALVVLAGVGFGILDLLLNLVLARAGSRGPALLMAVSAAFGISAIATPLLIGRWPSSLAVPFWSCAAGAALLTALGSRVRVRDDAADDLHADDGSSRGHGVLAAALLGAVLLGYVTLEGGVAGWETTHLRATTDLSESHAAQSVALFWGGLAVGRLLAAPLAARVHPGTLIALALPGAALCLAGAAHPPLAVAAYALAGLVLAPIFPAVVSWHARCRPDGRGIAALFAVGLAGPILTAPLIGRTVDAHGGAAIPWVLALLAVLGSAVALAARLTRALR